MGTDETMQSDCRSDRAEAPDARGLTPSRGAAAVVGWYLLFASLWILLSDKVVSLLTTDADTRILLSTWKGLLYVLVTGLLLHVLIRRLGERLRSTDESLAASEAQARAMFDHTAVLSGVLRPDGTVLDVNSAALTMIGKQPADVIGQPFWETPWWTHSPELQARLRETVEQAAAGRPGHLDATHLDVDGGLRVIDFSIVPVRDAAGEVVLLVPQGFDITARVRATEALFQSEERFAKAFMLHPAPMSITSQPDGRVLEVNESCLKLFEATREELVGHTTTELGLWADPADRDVVLGQVRSEGRVREIEVRVRTLKGRIRVCRWSAEALELDGQQCLLVEAEDITEQKRLAEQAARHHRELTLLNRVMSATASDLEPRDVLEIACRELAEAFGLPLASASLLNETRTGITVVAEHSVAGRPSVLGASVPLHGNPLVDYLLEQRKPYVSADPKHDPTLAALRELAVRRGMEAMLAIPLTTNDEVVGCLVLGSTEPRTFDPAEVALAETVAGQVSGVLERARLSEASRRLMTAIEQVPESVLITDAAGRMLYVNPAFERVTGFSRTEAIGENPRLLKSDRHDAVFYTQLWATVSAGEVWQGRFINRRRDGSLFTEDAVITPVRDEAGAITNYIAVKRDITAELDREERYRQSQRLESIGRLAGGVAHDFNNILTVILGHTEMARMVLAPDAEVLAELESIEHGAERAANLTRQLLAFARRQVTAPEVLDLNREIDDLSRLLRRLIGEDITLETALAEDVCCVKADPGQVEQVLMNLAVNARDAMRGGGQLRIATQPVELEPARADALEVAPGAYVELAVSDTGDGISDEVRPHVFEPFFTTKDTGKGTGLGLATCYGIARQTGGGITVESTLGGGSTFRVYLPRVSAEQLAAEPDQRADRRLDGHESILLTEDEDDLRELLVRMLEQHGYQVLAAENGRVALELAAAHDGPIDLLVTDVVMPETGGLELAQKLQSLRPETRRLFISGHLGDEALDPGAMVLEGPLLCKPFTQAELMAAVRDVLDGD